MQCAVFPVLKCSQQFLLITVWEFRAPLKYVTRLPSAAGERGWNNGRSIVQSNPDQKRTAVRECQPSILHHSQGEAH